MIIKKERCLSYFISDQQSQFFKSEGFSYLINQIQKSPERLTLKEKNTANGPRLLLSIADIKDVKSLIKFFLSISNKTKYPLDFL